MLPWFVRIIRGGSVPRDENVPHDGSYGPQMEGRHQGPGSERKSRLVAT
jgi:hypothetical protein